MLDGRVDDKEGRGGREELVEFLLKQHSAKGARGGVVGADAVAPKLDVVVGGVTDGGKCGLDVEEVVFGEDPADLGDKGR